MVFVCLEKGGLTKQRMEPKVSPPLGPHAPLEALAPAEGTRAFFVKGNPKAKVVRAQRDFERPYERKRDAQDATQGQS